jgi:5-methylcytosine-specific restriction endonuclease McrA
VNRYSTAHKLCLEIAAVSGTPCWICARPIRYRTEGSVHYIIRIADGGDPLDQNNMVPTHKQCVPPTNSRKW